MKKNQKRKSAFNRAQIGKVYYLNEINKQMIKFCKVMSEPTRFQIVALLRNGALPVQEIAETLKKTDSNVSHQLRLLKLHGVVKGKRVAKFRLYDLTKQFKQKLSSFFSQY